MSDSKAAPQKHYLVIGAALTALIAAAQVSTALYTPSLPALAEAFDASVEDANLTLSVFLAAVACAQLVYGPLSDRYGRRRVLFGGIFFYTVMSALCAFAPTLEWLIVGRFFQAIGACVGPVLGRAMVRDIYGGRGAAKAMAYIGLAFALSPALTPVLGGYMQAWFGWQSNFILLTVFGLFLLVTISVLMPETHEAEAGKKVDLRHMADMYKLLLKSPVVMGNVVSVALVFGGMMTFVAVGPFLFMDTLGLPPESYGMMPALSVIGLVIGNLLVGRYTLTIGPERMLVAGLVVVVLSSLGIVGFGWIGEVSIAAIIVPFGFYLFGVGLIFPNATAGAMAPHPQAAGTASALVGFSQIGMGAVASRIGGFLPHHDQLAMGVMMFGVCLGSLIIFMVFVWPNRMKETET